MTDSNKTKAAILLTISTEQFFGMNISDDTLKTYHKDGNELFFELSELRTRMIPASLPVYWLLSFPYEECLNETNQSLLSDLLKSGDKIVTSIFNGMPHYLYSEKEFDSEWKAGLSFPFINSPDLLRANVPESFCSFPSEGLILRHQDRIFTIPVLRNSIKKSFDSRFKIRKLIREKTPFLIQFDHQGLRLSEKEKETMSAWFDQKSERSVMWMDSTDFLAEITPLLSSQTGSKVDDAIGWIYRKGIDTCNLNHYLPFALTDSGTNQSAAASLNDKRSSGTLFSDMNGQVTLSEEDLTVMIDQGRLSEIRYKDCSFIKNRSDVLPGLFLQKKKKTLPLIYRKAGSYAFESEGSRGLRESLRLSHPCLKEPVSLINDYLFAGDFPYIIIKSSLELPVFRNPERVQKFHFMELPLCSLLKDGNTSAGPMTIEGLTSWGTCYKYRWQGKREYRLFPGNQFLFHLPEGTIHLKLIHHNEHQPLSLEIQQKSGSNGDQIILNPWGTYCPHDYQAPVQKTFKGTLLLGFYPKYVNFHEVEKTLPQGLLNDSLY